MPWQSSGKTNDRNVTQMLEFWRLAGAQRAYRGGPARNIICTVVMLVVGLIIGFRSSASPGANTTVHKNG